MRTEFLTAKPAQSRDSASALPAGKRQRRSVSDRVREALDELCGSRGNIVTHREKAWASITFAGTRHEIMITFDDETAIQAGETFIATLPDHEFAIPGQLVAEASIASVDHTLHPQPRLVVKVSLLLLEEA